MVFVAKRSRLDENPEPGGTARSVELHRREGAGRVHGIRERTGEVERADAREQGLPDAPSGTPAEVPLRGPRGEGRELCIGGVQIHEGGHRAEVEVWLGRQSQRFFYRSGDLGLLPSREAGLAVALLPAMRSGARLRVEGCVSGRLLSGVDTIQAIYRAWDSKLQRVEITAAGLSDAAPEGRRVGSFFSGGVDSFYTLLKHRDEITDLLLVHGFDIGLERADLRAKTSEAIREIGAEFGKRVVEIETDLRSFLDPHAHWGLLGHGPALASVGMVLSAHYRRIYIPGSYGYAHLFPWGTHPVLDPLWSTGSVEFVHDGTEATRVEKIARVAQCEVALRHLRVCYANPGGAYNCGVCEKCLRTMIGLRLAGALDRCASFDLELDLGGVARLRLREEHERAFAMEILGALGDGSADRAVEKALRAAMGERGLRRARPALGTAARALRSRYRRLRDRAWSGLPGPTDRGSAAGPQ